MGDGLLGKGPLAPPGSQAGGKRPGLQGGWESPEVERRKAGWSVMPQVPELRPPWLPPTMPRGCYLDDSHKVPQPPPWDTEPFRRAKRRDTCEVPLGVRRRGVSTHPGRASLLSHPSPQRHLPGPFPSQCGGQGGARRASHEDLGQGVGAGAGDEGLAGVAGDSVDGLLVLLAVGCDLLHACFVVQAPQAQGTVVACAGAGAERAVPRHVPWLL